MSDDIKAGSRWDVLSRTFGLVRASGDLTRDLDEHKRVGLQRGFAVQSVKRVASDSEGSEVFEFIASSGGDVKRDGNAVLNGPQNWTLENFRMNPRFTWNHSYDTLPLGTVVDVRPEGSGQSAILRSFHRFSKRWDFAEIVKGMYLDGDLDCVSIGWTPLEYERILGQDGKPEGWRFTLNELLEIAAVVIPADPKARLVGIQRKLQRGLIPESFVEYLSLDKYLREISHGDIYVLDHRSPLSTNKDRTMNTDDNAPMAIETPAEITAETPAAPAPAETVATDATVSQRQVETAAVPAGEVVRSEVSDAVDIELAKVSGLHESLEYEVECLVNCGKMLPYATDGDAGMGRHLNVARALVTEIDGCLAAIADVMSASPESTDPYPRPVVVVEAPEGEDGGGEMEMSGPAGEVRVGKKISATRMAKLKDAMQYAADAYRCVRAVVADAADGELDGKIAEGEDPPMKVEPMADPTKEQAIDVEAVAVRSADPDETPADAPADAPSDDDAAKFRAVFASLVETAGIKRPEPASSDDMAALAAKAADAARSAKAYADAFVGDLRRKR
jgi:hypothetical protein